MTSKSYSQTWPKYALAALFLFLLYAKFSKPEDKKTYEYKSEPDLQKQISEFLSARQK